MLGPWLGGPVPEEEEAKEVGVGSVGGQRQLGVQV